jgi:hypothetical protein
MEIYCINISKSQWQGNTIWTGTITEILRLRPGQKVSVIISEEIGRNSIQEAINEIAKESEKLDFENHKIMLVPTFEWMSRPEK